MAPPQFASNAKLYELAIHLSLLVIVLYIYVLFFCFHLPSLCLAMMIVLYFIVFVFFHCFVYFYSFLLPSVFVSSFDDSDIAGWANRLLVADKTFKLD